MKPFGLLCKEWHTACFDVYGTMCLMTQNCGSAIKEDENRFRLLTVLQYYKFALGGNMFHIQYYTHRLMKIGDTRPGKVFYSILAGSIGAIILVLFLTGMTYTATIADVLPVIIGFNTALTGYMALEKTRDGFKHKRTVAIGSGAVMVLVTSALLNLMFLRGAAIFLIDVEQLMTLLFIGIVTSGLGGMLAIKYLSLKR